MASNLRTGPASPTSPTRTTIQVFPATLVRLHSIRDKLWLNWGSSVTLDEVINELADKYEAADLCPEPKVG